MTRRQALLFVGVAVVVGLLVGTLWFRRAPRPAAPTVADPAAPDLVAAVAGSVTLYFPGADGLLHPEVRGLDTQVDGSELARRIVAGLLAGPDTADLFAPLPSSTQIAAVVLGSDGVLYLDLASDEFATPPAAGSQRELLAAYSLVNSICANVPRIRGVALLWNGEERTTFAGNLDTTRPLAPNRRLVSAG
jgi:Sporulation and spore germination